jgi:uncharacterized protein
MKRPRPRTGVSHLISTSTRQSRRTTKCQPKVRLRTYSKPMLKKRLFVALSKAVAPAEQMLPNVTEHLRYMTRLEAEGLLFASGPFVQEGVLVGDGLTILRTETIEQARALMDAEPLTAGGFRQYELRSRELREGRITVTLSASAGSFHL